MAWSRHTRDDGLVTAMFGPSTVSDLAAAFEPTAPWVLVTELGSLLGSGWAQARVPLHESEALHPRMRLVRSLSFEVLLSTDEFLELAPAWGDQGIRAHQLTRRPDDQVNFRTKTPATRYRAFGLVVAIDLPHAHEVAQLIATGEQAMDQALGRLGVSEHGRAPAPRAGDRGPR